MVRTAFELDITQFPMVVSVFPSVVHGPALAEHLERYQDAVLERDEPYVSIIDATELESMLSAEARRIIIAARKRGIERGIGRLHRGIALVTTSVLLRTATSVVEWASPLPSTWTTVSTREAAFAWGYAQLEGRRDDGRWF